MDTEATRALVKQFLAARSSGDLAGITAALADDAEWVLPQSSTFGPFRGRDEVAKALGGGVSGSLFDLSMLMAFGLLGYLMRRLDYPAAPLVLGLVLGDAMERALRGEQSVPKPSQ